MTITTTELDCYTLTAFGINAQILTARLRYAVEQGVDISPIEDDARALLDDPSGVSSDSMAEFEVELAYHGIPALPVAVDDDDDYVCDDLEVAAAHARTLWDEQQQSRSTLDEAIQRAYVAGMVDANSQRSNGVKNGKRKGKGKRRQGPRLKKH